MDFLKNKNIYYRLFLIISLLTVYFLTGKTGLSFALPPGFSSPVWPPSGISLAALLIFGPSIWPGVFLGSFLTNTWPFASFSIIPLNIVIAAGASIQALVGERLLRSLGINYRNLFEFYLNVFYFIAIAISSCLINASIANGCLYIFGIISSEALFESWATWWLGDTAGVCVMTPFLLVWFIPVNWDQLYHRSLEAIILLTSATISLLFIFEWKYQDQYPLAYITILFLLWAVFRFNAQITMIILFISMIIATWKSIHGYGPFVQLKLNTSLILLQIYTLVITCITLALISLLSELRKAYELLKQYSTDLELKFQERTLQLQDRSKQLQEQAAELTQQNQILENTLLEVRHIQRRMVTQEKLASLGTLTAGLAQQMRNPLNFVINFSDISLDLVSQLRGWLESDEFNFSKRAEVIVNLSTLQTNLQKVHQYGMNANKIVERMVFQVPGRMTNYQNTNLNALLEEYLSFAYSGFMAQNLGLSVTIEKFYDPAVGRIETIPEDLGRAFINIVTNAFESVKEKKQNLGDSFIPTILIRTQDLNADNVAIIVKDNGKGISDTIRKKIFIPFSTTELGQGIGLGLPISHDLIVQNLGGEIKVNSVEGEYAEFTIIIPKTAQSF